MGMSLAELEGLRMSSEPLRFEALDETYSDSSMAFADDQPDSLALLADEELRQAWPVPSAICRNGCRW
jgi:RNA polymerase sigma factor for flagellar operon FliA